ILLLNLTGCTDHNDRKQDLYRLIQTFQTALIEKDLKAQKRLFAEGVIDIEQANEGNNFLSIGTVSQSITDDEAIFKLKTNFEEQQNDNEYINLIGYITLTINYEDTGWLITNFETEIDPSTPRPQRP